MDNAADLVIVRVGAPNRGFRERDRYDAVWNVKVLRVMVAVQLWLRNIAVDMARRRSRNTVIGSRHRDHSLMSGVERPLCKSQRRPDESSGVLPWCRNSFIQAAGGGTGMRTPLKKVLLAIFLLADEYQIAYIVF